MRLKHPRKHNLAGAGVGVAVGRLPMHGASDAAVSDVHRRIQRSNQIIRVRKPRAQGVADVRPGHRIAGEFKNDSHGVPFNGLPRRRVIPWRRQARSRVDRDTPAITAACRMGTPERIRPRPCVVLGVWCIRCCSMPESRQWWPAQGQPGQSTWAQTHRH